MHAKIPPGIHTPVNVLDDAVLDEINPELTDTLRCSTIRLL